MDGLVMAGLMMAAVGGFSIPTYIALFRVHGKLGNHGARLNSIEKKIDTLNGNVKK